MSRRATLEEFYSLLDTLEQRVGGTQRLGDCTGYMDWPDRGVYFFFSADEQRTASDQRRVTRIGTHAVSTGSNTTLWDRLRTHRGATSGTYQGGGNHRGSVFRKRIGEALIEREGLHDQYPHWGEGSSAGRERRLAELELERRVSEYIRDLPFLWIDVPDRPGPESTRAVIERNAIALVSNYETEPIDPRADTWLGTDSQHEAIRQSGLWNVDHVDDPYDPPVLDKVANGVAQTDPV